MDKQLDIAAFNRLLQSSAKGDALLVALQKLTQVKDPKSVRQVRVSPQPLGSWGGWGRW